MYRKKEGKMEDIKKEVGILLREYRNRQGYSLEDVITLLEKQYKIKMNQSTLTRYEKGEIGALNPVLLKGICKIIKLNYLEIFGKLDFVDKDISLDPRVASLNKRELNQYEVTLSQASSFFGDEKVSEEDKKKLLDAMTEMFFVGKAKNKEKYAKNKTDKK